MTQLHHHDTILADLSTVTVTQYDDGVIDLLDEHRSPLKVMVYWEPFSQSNVLLDLWPKDRISK